MPVVTNNKVVIFLADNPPMSDQVVRKPRGTSDRAWRAVLRNKTHLPLYRMLHQYGRLVLSLRDTPVGDMKWDFSYRITQIITRLQNSYVPRGSNARDFIYFRSSFLVQMVHEIEMYCTDTEDGVRYDPKHVMFVTLWVQNVMEHFLDGGGIHVVPHFEMFISPHLSITVFESMVERIDWMRSKYGYESRIIALFLQVC